MGMVAHTFNPSTWETEAGGFLVYKVNSRTARVTERNPVLKDQSNNKNPLDFYGLEPQWLSERFRALGGYNGVKPKD